MSRKKCISKKDFGDSPGESKFSSRKLFRHILLGIVLPLIVAGYGFYACVMQSAVLPGKRGKLLELTNITAMSYGVALVGLAVFLHFIIWWSPESKKYQIAEICAIIAMIIFILAFGFAFWRIIYYCEACFV